MNEGIHLDLDTWIAYTIINSNIELNTLDCAYPLTQVLYPYINTLCHGKLYTSYLKYYYTIMCVIFICA